MRQIIIKNLVILLGKYKESGDTLWVKNIIGKGGTLFFRKYYVNFTLGSTPKTLSRKCE